MGSAYGLKLGYIWMWLSFISHLIFLKAFDKKLSKNAVSTKRKRSLVITNPQTESLQLYVYFFRLPAYAGEFIEMCLMITADHGPGKNRAETVFVFCLYHHFSLRYSSLSLLTRYSRLSCSFFVMHSCFGGP